MVRGFFMYCKAWFEPCRRPATPPTSAAIREMHAIFCYPAFHGYDYRQAYNYRPLFEYPWQAGMNEPLPLEATTSERSLVGKSYVPEPGPAEVVPVLPTPDRSIP